MKNNKIGAFTRMCCTIGNLPSSYMISMTYEEQLLWLCNFLEKTVIPAVNNNAEAVEELQAQFNLLKSYVDNYFDNLDIQTEINNKLDEMAESGELTDIIAQYLQLAGLLVYGNLSLLKNAENLANGSFCKVYGLTSYKDGKSENYIIRQLTSGDVIDDDNIVALTNYPTLVAEKIIGNISTYEITENMTQQEIQNIMNLNRNKVLDFTGSNYTFDSTFRLNKNTKLLLNNATLTFDLPAVGDDYINCHGFYNFNDEDEFLGYEGNGNIEVIGGTIIGGNFSLIHGNHLVFNGIHFENCKNGHIIELASCNDVIVEGCTFKGASPFQETKYEECIQFESSTYDSFPFFTDENNPTYDETPSKNIIIRNNNFTTPTDVNFGFYNGVGNHVVQTYQNENIIIENNNFDSPTWYSIQLVDAKNCIIKNNIFNKTGFESTDGLKTHVLVADNIDKIDIENNIFKGNLRAIGTNSPYGTSSNISIINNKFYDYNGDNGYEIIEIINSNNLDISNNIFNEFNQPVFRLRKEGSTDVSSYITYFKNNTITSSDINYQVSQFEYGKVFIENNYINSVASSSEKAFNINNATVGKCYIKGNITNLTNVVDYHSTTDRSSIYDVIYMSSDLNISSATDNINIGANIFDYNTLYLTLGWGANTQFFTLKCFEPDKKLDARSYYLSAVNNGQAQEVIFKINNDGTIYYSPSSSGLPIRRVSLVNNSIC